MDRLLCLVAEKEGERLDKYIAERLPELSRSQVQKLIEGGNVTVNDRSAKSRTKVTPGDRLKIILSPPSPSPLQPEALPLNILYEDDDIMVLDKPPGISAHPAPGHPGGTLLNAVIARYPRLAEMGQSLRPGIVHRLDKDTSGVMVIAKNIRAQANLVNQFKARTVAKSYLTLVKGRLEPERGIIEAPLGRDPADRKRMAVVSDGREARTAYRVLKYFDGYSLLEVRPETGRTHQIRVHLAAIGYPVVGDAFYGVKSPYLNRQFLHAHRLAFKLPSTSETVEFKSELPADLDRALREIERL